MAATRTARDERGSHQHTFRRVRMPPNFFAIAFAPRWSGRAGPDGEHDRVRARRL